MKLIHMRKYVTLLSIRYLSAILLLLLPGVISAKHIEGFRVPSSATEFHIGMRLLIESDNTLVDHTKRASVLFTFEDIELEDMSGLELNSAPVFTSAPLTGVSNEDIYNYEIGTSDLDGDEVTVTATQLPSWLSLAHLPGTTVIDFFSPINTISQAVGVAVDHSGNVFFTSHNKHSAFKLQSDGQLIRLGGNNIPGFTNGTNHEAQFDRPWGIDVDSNGNVFIADAGNNVIRKIASDGVVSTFAGSGVAGFVNGTGTAASFYFPAGVLVDSNDDIYVADNGNHVIRKITQNGVVSTFAGSGIAGFDNGLGTEASFNSPEDIVQDNFGNFFVAGGRDYQVRKITPDGIVSPFVGSLPGGITDGTGTSAQFGLPRGIAIDKANNLYLTEGQTNNIRKITRTGVVTTLASISGSMGIDIDSNGNLIIGAFSSLKKISGNPLSLSGEATGYVGTHPVTLKADDGNGGTTIQQFDIVVSDNIGPVFSSSTAIDFVERGTGVVYTAIAADAASFTYSMAVADDSNLFEFDGESGEVTFKAAPSFDNPQDADQNNIYSITILASDEYGNVTEQIVTITVTKNDLPIFTSIPVTNVDESQVYTYSITTSDPDSEDINVTGSVLPSWLSLTSNPGEFVSTFTGTGFSGNMDGTGKTASFAAPYGLTLDKDGNLYVSETHNHKIRKITSSGIVTTFAGSGTQGYVDGIGTMASFNGAGGMTVDDQGNIYAADFFNHVIRKIDSEGTVTTFAGSGTAGFEEGTGSLASFNRPLDVEIDQNGNLFVADTENHSIRKITPEGVVSTFAGMGSTGMTNGTRTSASFNRPVGLDIDTNGNIYVVDSENNIIRKINADGVVSTLAGSGSFGSADGIGTLASFNRPSDLALDAFGNIYVVGRSNYSIRKINAQTNDVSTFAGTTRGNVDGIGTSARFNGPTQITIDEIGNIYIADQGNHIIRKVSSGDLILTGTAPAAAGIHDVSLIANDGNVGDVEQSFIITVNDVTTPVFTSGITESFAENGVGIVHMVVATDTNALTYSLGSGNDEALFDIVDGMVTFKTPPDFESPADGDANNSYIIEVKASDGTNTASQIVTINVTGLNDNSPVFSSTPVTSVDEGAVYSYKVETTDLDQGDNITVTGSTLPSWLSLSTSLELSTIAGSNVAGFVNGFGLSSQFNAPEGIAVDGVGNLYVADRNNHSIRKITPEGVVTTLAGSGTIGFSNGTGTSAQFAQPLGLAVDAAGNVYVADDLNHKIRKITPDGVVSTFAGSSSGNSDGTGASAQFSSPSDIAIGPNGNFFITDTGNHSIRKITTSGVVTTLAGGAAGLVEGTLVNARFDNPVALDLDASGNIYVVDLVNQRIRKITHDGIVSTLAGSTQGFAEGTGSAAQFNVPTDVVVDKFGNILVVDRQNAAIRKITPEGVVSSLIGSITAGLFQTPDGIAVDKNGNTYITDQGSNLIRKLENVTELKGDATGQFGNHSIVLTATDEAGNKVDQTFTISINDVTPPIITSPSTANFAENGTGSAYTVTATDLNVLTYSLGTGMDETLFDIVGNSGLVTFKTPPDFESPGDRDANNTYVIEVKAGDGTNTVSQTVTITVTDVDEIDPVFTSATSTTFAENETGTAYTIVATDANQVTYSLGTGNDESLFNIALGVVTFKTPPDFESPGDGDANNTYVIEVKASDGTNTVAQTVTITVTNVDDTNPVFTSSVAVNFAENGTAAAYTAVATDANTLTYALGSGNDEALFDIVTSTGIVTFKSSPDFESPTDANTDNGYVIEVVARDGINEASQTVTITVTDVPEPVLDVTGDLTVEDTPLGLSSTFDITIQNTGDADLTVSNITYPNGFSGTSSSINLSPSASQVVTITFTPTEQKTYSGDIVITSDGGTATLAITAEGAIITGFENDPTLNNELFNVYPNPAEDVLTLDLSKYNLKPVNITIHNLSGVQRFSKPNYKESKLSIDISEYVGGVYLILVSDGNTTTKKKVIIKK